VAAVVNSRCGWHPPCCPGCCQVTDLRGKARLLVQRGATLVGVMDEYGLLEEGQVFVQVCGPASPLT
jgi:hypothetical protein